jgi:hypothetical protein
MIRIKLVLTGLAGMVAKFIATSDLAMAQDQSCLCEDGRQ